MRRGGAAVVRGRPARHRPSRRYGVHPGHHRPEPGRHGAAAARNVCRERLAGSSEHASDATGRPTRIGTTLKLRPDPPAGGVTTPILFIEGSGVTIDTLTFDGDVDNQEPGELCEFVDGPER